MTRPRDLEYQMQALFFLAVDADPHLRDLPIYAVPNFAGNYGDKLSRVVNGLRAKRSGRRKGVPDVCVDVARGGFHGLRIEFKVEGNAPKPEQDEWHQLLREHGFCVLVLYDANDAHRYLHWYLAGDERAAHMDRICEAERAARTSRRRPRRGGAGRNAINT